MLEEFTCNQRSAPKDELQRAAEDKNHIFSLSFFFHFPNFCVGSLLSLPLEARGCIVYVNGFVFD